LYCTYLTIYYGNKLPRRYIGSAQVKRIHNGYNGSIKSKKYKMTYFEEQVENKQLFKTRILNTYQTQEEAIKAERDLQIKYDVVKSSDYMNESIAMPNGFFGRDVSKELHPLYGKSHTKKTKKKLSDAIKQQYETGKRKSPFKYMSFDGKNNPFYGKNHSDESKSKMRKPKKFVPKWKCPSCDKVLDGGNLFNHAYNKHGISKEELSSYRKNTKPVNTNDKE